MKLAFQIFLNKNIFPIILLFFFLFNSYLQITSSSITFDEPAHIKSGLEWLTTGFSNSDPFTPPFSKIPFGIYQLVGLNLFNDPFLIIPRFTNTILTAVFFIYFYFFIKKQFSFKVAIISLFLLIVEPNVIGYTHLATTETMTMITFFLAFSQIIIFIQNKKNNLLPVIISIIFLYITKSVFLPAFLPIIILASPKLKKIKFKKFLTQSSLAFLVFIILILLISGFHTYPAFADKFSIPGGGVINSTFSAVSYVVNPKFIPTRQIIFMGNISHESSYLYIPLSFLLKTSPHLLILLTTGIFLVLFRKIKDKKIIFGIITIFSCISIVTLGNYNTGVRHLLPAFPIISFISGFVLLEFVLKKLNLKKIIISSLIFISIIICLRNKDSLAYFNPVIGSKEGSKILTESNFDWGQSLPYLQKENQKIDYLVSSTNEDSQKYGIYAPPLPSDWKLNIQKLNNKNIFISNTAYYKSGLYEENIFSIDKAEYSANNTYFIFKIRGNNQF